MYHHGDPLSVPDEYWNLRADDLRDMPTLATGQIDSLKIEDLERGIRVWICRAGIEDGMPADNIVTIERRNTRGEWRDAYTYEGR